MTLDKTKKAGLVVAAVVCFGLARSLGDGDRGGALAQQDTWTTPDAQRLGVRLLEQRDAAGPAAYPVAPGDILFFTNSGTSYGGKNPKNSVVVVDARTKKPIAFSDLDAKYSAELGSHGIGMSLDAKYIYLPSMTSIPAALNSTPAFMVILDARTLKIHQVTATGGTPHHAKAFRDGSGRSLVLIEHFNWSNPNSAGRGFYIVDPADHNKVIAGMSAGDLHGNPYSGFTTPDGRFLYYSVPPPNRGEVGREIRGWLAKIDTSNWRVVQSLAMGRFPIWTEFSKDGRWAWVTNAEDSKVVKIERATGSSGRDKVVAEVESGHGPYGLRMNWDDTELWIADKGEGGPSGKTITIVDAAKNAVKATVETNCLRNDHIIISPDGSEMWAMCNESHDIVVLDAKTHAVKHRIPMPNNGDVHGGIFVAYSRSGSGVAGEVVSDQNGLHGSALAAAMKGTAWTPPAR